MKPKKSQRVFVGILLIGFLLFIAYVSYQSYQSYTTVYNKSANEPYIKFTSRPKPTTPVISYTTKGQAGDTCFVNEQCESGQCGTKFQCENVSDKNCVCESDHYCAFETASEKKVICCHKDNIKKWWTTYYCGGMKDGSACWSDAMCESGYCKGNWGGVNPDGGTCTRKKADGETCEANNDCQNGGCGRGTAEDNAGLVCCPGGSMGTYAANDYCYKMPHGSKCWSDAMCADGRCGGVAGLGGVNVTKGTCMTEDEYRQLPPPEANLLRIAGDTAKDIGNQIEQGIKPVSEPVSNFFNDVGDTLGSIFGR